MKFTTGLVVRTVARVSLLISSDVHYIVFTVWLHFCLCIMLSMSSELIFVAFHIANHIYCILSFTVCTHDACTYHGHHILPFIIHVYMHDALTYHCLVPMWGSLRLAPIMAKLSSGEKSVYYSTTNIYLSIFKIMLVSYVIIAISIVPLLYYCFCSLA